MLSYFILFLVWVKKYDCPQMGSLGLTPLITYRKTEKLQYMCFFWEMLYSQERHKGVICHFHLSEGPVFTLPTPTVVGVGKELVRSW